MSRKNDAMNDDVNLRNEVDFKNVSLKHEGEMQDIHEAWENERKSVMRKSKKRGWFW